MSEYSLPCVPLRDMVFFPHMMTPVFVGRGRSLATVESIPPDVQRVFLVTQRDARQEEPEADDLFRVGTEAEIHQMIRLNDGAIKLLMEGVGRCQAVDFHTAYEGLWANLVRVEEPANTPVEELALSRALLAQLEDYLRLCHRIPHEVYAEVESMETPSAMADAVAACLPFKTADKQRLLEILDAGERMRALSSLIADEIELLKVERKLRGRVRRQMDRSQKEFFLNEQLRAIQRELGQPENLMGEGEELRQRTKGLRLPKEVAEKVDKEIQRLEMMTPLSPEASVVRNYVEWLLDVPWQQRTRGRNDLAEAAEILERDHYGLKKVKERIVEHIAVRMLNKAIRGPILCLVGPPGVGKTSLGRSIAGALGRKFVRVSLGGIRDEAEIRGHRRTYIGALPGRIIQSMKRAGKRNPVFLLDEVDKMSADFRGDPASALLEALDPEQNRNFSDHFLEVDYDLSQVFFITTANTTDAIPAALLDRMEVIRLPGYTYEEKTQIAKRFLLHRQIKENGLRAGQLKVADAAIVRVIHEYTREAGVRNLERELGKLCRKVARRMVEKRSRSKAKKKAAPAQALVRLAAKNLEEYLGSPRFTPERPDLRAEVGVATGLAWTSVGGVLLPVEVSVFEGKGNLTLTGKLGEVMKESAHAGLSWLRSRAKDLGVPADIHEKRDIHIHLPEGAIPKDGPSAGITMALALCSAMTGRKVRRNVAMSGEVTLRGRVLPVGGVKEKMLAARRGRIPRVILPRECEKDVNEVEAEGPLGLEVVYVDTMDEVIRECLLPEAGKGGADLAKAGVKVKGKRPGGVPRSPARGQRSPASKVRPTPAKKTDPRGRRPSRSSR